MNFDYEKLISLILYDPNNPLLFNNGFFIYFFFIFLTLYFIFRNKILVRNYIFCFFSLYFFYKASGAFVILVILSAIFDFYLSNKIYTAKSLVRKKSFLILSILFNLGILIYFKYTNFFIETLNNLFSVGFNPLNILLPVGISFYTFENLSYTIDVYRGDLKPVRKFVDYLLFLSFFPKLVMGPIVRANDFLPQINNPYVVSENDFAHGFFLIFSGLFKKLIISDYITLNFVNYVFDDPSRFSGLENLFAVYGYAIVIYCDFSGYSDTAIGLAKWLGYSIPKNFSSPYKSITITDFWHRWHISLSSWLRDYLYIPLGGNKVSSFGTWFISTLFFIALFYILNSIFSFSFQLSLLLILGAILILLLLSFLLPKTFRLTTNLNLISTMLLGGLWHGASWNFIIWGMLHGIFLLIHKTWSNLFGNKLGEIRDTKLYNFISLIITFHIVCFSWIFFRADSFYIANILISQIIYNFNISLLLPFLSNYWNVLLMILLGFVLHFKPNSMSEKFIQFLVTRPIFVYLFFFTLFLFAYGLFKSSESVMPIYLQF